MDYLSKETYDKELQWLHDNIPPDDIYAFAYESFIASEYFLWHWSQWVNLHERAAFDANERAWINRICAFRFMMMVDMQNDNRN